METKPQINWQDYIRIFLRRKWLFIIPFVCVFILFIAAGLVMPKGYEARATILVEEETIVNPLLSNLAVSTSLEDRLHKLTEEILSWPRLLQLVEELKLNKNVNNPLELEALISGIRNNISLQMKGRDIIRIYYKGEDAHITQEVVNTLCDILIRKNIFSQSEEADSAIMFIAGQLKIYKAKLEASEEALRKFKETYGLQIPLAARINKDLAELEAQLTGALVDCTEEHPRVGELRRRIASLKEKRLEQIQKTAEGVEGKDYQDYIDIADSIPKQEQALARLTRDEQVNVEIYSMLLQKLETARISKHLESSESRTKFKIIEPARFPLIPITPNLGMINLFGLILGGGLGVGAIYLVENNDHSFKKADDLRDLFNLPVFASISKIITQEDIQRKKAGIKRILIFAAIILPGLIILTMVITKLIF